MSLSLRVDTHAKKSAELACLSDATLLELLRDAKPMHSGIGGNSVLLELGDTRVFVKKVPLTDLERKSENMMSTANIFKLPLFYQYGIGSAGFGAWRELAAHALTTNWILSGECTDFPLLYHWRVLPSVKAEPMNTVEQDELESAVQYWQDSPAVRTRLEAIHGASAQIVLFLEYFPQTLHDWFAAELISGSASADRAIAIVDENLTATNNFMSSRGFVHFDAHFQNILTDGGKLFFSDFGLALSSSFELTAMETEFLNNHRAYDRCTGIGYLLYSIITSAFGKDKWMAKLQNCLNSAQEKLSAFMVATISKYAPVVLITDTFYRELKTESKLTPFPACALEAAFATDLLRGQVSETIVIQDGVS